MSYALKAAKAGPRGVRGAQKIVKGDPGLFGGIVGAIGGGLKGLATGGIAGAVSGAVSGAKKGYAGPGVSVAPPVGQMPILTATPTAGPSLPTLPRIGGSVSTSLSFGTQTRTAPVQSMGLEYSTNGACPRGYHLNKSSYFLMDGTYVPKGSRMVKNRKRNPLNPRALDRAMGRLTSAKKASRKLSRISIRKASCSR